MQDALAGQLEALNAWASRPERYRSLRRCASRSSPSRLKAASVTTGARPAIRRRAESLRRFLPSLAPTRHRLPALPARLSRQGRLPHRSSGQDCAPNADQPAHGAARRYRGTATVPGHWWRLLHAIGHPPTNSGIDHRNQRSPAARTRESTVAGSTRWRCCSTCRVPTNCRVASSAPSCAGCHAGANK